MNVADTMFHLDAVARSVPEPVLPPDALNSQISGILRATRPFLETDRDWILQNIELFQQQLSGYDALLDRIDEVRLEMQRRRDVVHRSMASYSSTLAPIRRLPSDIFRAVFREVQILPRCNAGDESESESEFEEYVLDFSQGPWKLSHVCGAWRDIILSYPQLWSHIVLQYNWTSYPMETLHHTMSALQAMISRSAQHPLDIVFELDGNGKEDAAIQTFPVILEESYRWRSINLQISLPLLERLKVVRGKIPCLESLNMKTAPAPSHYFITSWHGTAPSGTYGIQELPEEDQTVFIDAPRLRKVILYHTHGLGDFMFPPHITHLATRIGNLSSLEAYRSLVECRLFEKKEPGPDVFPPHPIHLPNLRRLYVSSLYLLAYLRLPSLDDLMISFVDNASDIDDVVLVINEFIHHSRCTLTSLAIHNLFAFQQVFIEDCLLLMDSLVSLEIRLFPYADVKVIFNALASSKFLPNLQHLLLRVPCTQPSLWEPLTAMIRSRSQYLRSIRISCSGADDAETVDELLAPLWLPGLSMVVSMDNAISDFENFGSR
ncbi:hypothetical protein EDD85DRAFT_831675 [Armillaria nabsnona]|nr:hypothetical protein EDD85DRAFT_831675 [Armillaria nabsnona]